jgi:hypothetical protein
MCIFNLSGLFLHSLWGSFGNLSGCHCHLHHLSGVLLQAVQMHEVMGAPQYTVNLLGLLEKARLIQLQAVIRDT